MKLMQDVIIIYAVGCLFSYGCLMFCGMLGGQKQLQTNVIRLGASLSWLVVIYFFILLGRGYLIKKAEDKKVKEFESGGIVPPLSDAEMIKDTIDNYWVYAVGDDLFDPDASLPIKDSPLCKMYYKQKRHHEMAGSYTSHCSLCPIHKMGFGCTRVKSLWSIYSGLSVAGKPRQDSAMRMAKLFESIYKEELLGRN